MLWGAWEVVVLGAMRPPVVVGGDRRARGPRGTASLLVLWLVVSVLEKP